MFSYDLPKISLSIRIQANDIEILVGSLIYTSIEVRFTCSSFREDAKDTTAGLDTPKLPNVF